MSTRYGSLEQRFDRHVCPEPNSGCWLWDGPWDKGFGYGRMGIGKTGVVRAHRYAYERFVGVIPDGMCVCHRCDTPACVNPDHLFLGTKSDNTRDRYEKGRSAKGETAGRAKLSDNQVIEIRNDARSGPVVAKAFGVSHSLVKQIRRRDIWTHI